MYLVLLGFLIMKQLSDFLDTYLSEISQRKSVTKARNYFEDTTLPYLYYINWDSSDPRGFFKDLDLFWMKAREFYKRHTHAEYVDLLEWVKKLDCLHPRQVVKAFLNKR